MGSVFIIVNTLFFSSIKLLLSIKKTPHLLFVDDTPIICDAYTTHLHYLRCILICFEPILGLRIILCNSKIGPKGEIVNFEKLASNLGCHVLKYSGLPLGAHFKARHIWDSIQERMHKKLVGWKKLYLSKGGILTIIKSMLSSLPKYFLSFFHCL